MATAFIQSVSADGNSALFNTASGVVVIAAAASSASVILGSAFPIGNKPVVCSLVNSDGGAVAAGNFLFYASCTDGVVTIEMIDPADGVTPVAASSNLTVAYYVDGR